MAEVQKSTNSADSAARFIEFVMLQAQNASLFLGLMPHPQSGQAETNLELARMFIDQLAMIQEKTRGNLSAEESSFLNGTLGKLQMAFFEVAQGGGDRPPIEHQLAQDEEPTPPVSESAPAPATPAAAAPADESRESKKRFSKSYGS